MRTQFPIRFLAQRDVVDEILNAIEQGAAFCRGKVDDGLGPNHLLAKIARKLEKPDGLSWLSPDDIPERLAEMPLDKFPGIAKGAIGS